MVITDSELEWYPNYVEMVANRPYGDNYVQVNPITEGDKRRQVAV